MGLWVLLGGLASVFLGSLSAAADTLTLIAVADARVLSSQPNTNFGTTNLIVQRNINTENQSYIKFDLTHVTVGTLDSATLRINLRQIGANTTVKIYSCDDDSFLNGDSLAAWAAMGITNASLAEFTIDDFEFVELGWTPPGL